MQSIDEQLDALLEEPLQTHSSGGTLGYVGLDLPPDLLLAGPRGSCHLPWRVTGDTPWADLWLESSFPGWARSILEDWSQGRFDGFKQVVFTRGEDVSQRLYYYVCELQRRGKLSGPAALIFDIARIGRPSSRRYTEQSLRQLVQQLELTTESLILGTRRANRLRTLFRGLRQPRQAPGSVYEKIVRASLFTDVEALISRLPRGPVASGLGRLVLGGSSPPDARIHGVIEVCGWQVAAEFCDRNLERLGETVEAADADPVCAISQHWLRQTFLGRDLKSAEQRLQNLLQDTQAEAAILWFARDDEALAWQVPRLRRALQSANIPFLLLSARDGSFADGAAQEIEAFLKGLKR